MLTVESTRRTQPHGPWLAVLALAVVALLLGGCATSAANLQGLAAAQAPTPASVSGVVAPISDYQLPGTLATPTPTPAPAQGEKRYVTVATQGVRANLRSGAGTNFDIVTKINPGVALEVLGKSQDSRWYKVVVPANAGATAKEAWISADLVSQGGAPGTLPVAASGGDILLNSDLKTDWKVDWSCNSDRCQVKQCTADVTAQVNRAVTDGFLPVEHAVKWADQCFNTDSWTFEVNQTTGKEKTGEAEKNFLYGYWLGAEPGEANGVFPVDDTRGVLVYCSGPHKVEIEEGGGWTTVYEGNTCHDMKTGMLVYMNYIKRWLYTGEFQGKTYERAYFGDSEKLEQKLVDSNVALEYVTKK